MVPSLAGMEIGDILWTIHVDGSSNSKGSGAGVMVENQYGVIIEVSLTFSFQTSNNKVEYEACIEELTLAKDFNGKRVEILTDSLLVVSKTSNEYTTKDVVLYRYLAKVKELIVHFYEVNVKHIPRGWSFKKFWLGQASS